MATDIHQAALRMLALRALSRREMAERLARKGFGPEAINAEIARLAAVGLVNDDELARAVTRAQLGDGRGRRAVATVLRRRGVEREAASAALGALGEEEEAAALAHAVVRAARKYPGFRRLPPVRRKVIRYLLARGFGLAAVCRALADDAGEGADAGEFEVVEPGDPEDIS